MTKSSPPGCSRAVPARSSMLVKTGAAAAAALVGATTVAAPAEAAFVKTAISFPYVAYGQDIGSYHGGIVDLDTSRTGQNAVTPYYAWICRRQAWQMVSYPYNPDDWTFSSQSPYYSPLCQT